MRPLVVALASPIFGDPGFLNAGEQLPIEQFVAQLVVDALDVGVLRERYSEHR